MDLKVLCINMERVVVTQPSKRHRGRVLGGEAKHALSMKANFCKFLGGELARSGEPAGGESYWAGVNGGSRGAAWA